MSDTLQVSEPLERLGPAILDSQVDPYPIYAKYRRADPIHWGAGPDHYTPDCWYLTRYCDVARVLHDPAFGHEVYRVVPGEQLPQLPEAFAPFRDMLGRWMIFRDPPDHTRLRHAAARAFRQFRLDDWQPRIAAQADALIAVGRRRGYFDCVADYAFPLPVFVIAEMLGIPSEERAALKHWSAALLGGIDLKRSDDAALAYEEATRASVELCDFLRDLIKTRRGNPGADMVSLLLAQETSLDLDEIIATCTLLLFAGHETTSNLIGNGVLALLRHPAQLALLLSVPEHAASAVEELARYDGPAQITFRYALEDVSLSGIKIRRGELIAAVIGAANRDPAMFVEPDRLDILRRRNQHLGFGVGPHTCLGAALARRETAIAITRLLQALPELRLTKQSLYWKPSVGLRGLASLPLLFSPSA